MAQQPPPQAGRQARRAAARGVITTTRAAAAGGGGPVVTYLAVDLLPGPGRLLLGCLHLRLLLLQHVHQPLDLRRPIPPTSPHQQLTLPPGEVLLLLLHPSLLPSLPCAGTRAPAPAAPWPSPRPPRSSCAAPRHRTTPGGCSEPAAPPTPPTRPPPHHHFIHSLPMNPASSPPACLPVSRHPAP